MLTREAYSLNAEMNNTMNERFNVAGALLVKLFGDPARETRLFSERAGRVRDIGVRTAMYGSALVISLTLLASLATALVYGLGGILVIDNFFRIGTLVALAALLGRLYGRSPARYGRPGRSSAPAARRPRTPSRGARSPRRARRRREPSG